MSDRAAVQTQTAVRPAITPVPSSVLQRQCACGQHTSTGGECEVCKKKREGTLQRAAINPAPVHEVPPIVHEVLRSPGQPLDAETRAFMEPSFGRDFSGVRVHTDAKAAESSRAVDARAYAIGHNIAFDRGQYQPHTTEGAALLAHELAHTVQQAGLRRLPAKDKMNLSSGGDASEREASAAADAVMHGFRPAIFARPSMLSLSRAPWGKCPAGERVSAAPESVNQKAELAFVEYYESVAKNKAHVLSNRKRIEDFFPKPPAKHARMLRAMDEMFRSDKPGFIRRTETVPLEEAGEVAAPSVEHTDEGELVGESTLGAIEGRERAALEPESEPKRPDIADLETREIYDVTTIGQADNKVAKIADNYVAQLERLRAYYHIGGKPWTAGHLLKRPPAYRLLYKGREQPAICFGLTDFTLRPGVVVYEAINFQPGATVATVTEPYEIATKAGKKATIDANFAPSATDLLNTGANNLAAAGIIRGLALKTLKRGKTPAQDRITACVVSEGCIETGGKPPIPIAITSGKGEIELKIDPKTHVISLARNYAGYKFKSKHLSEGTLTKIDIDADEGVRGAGKLKPSLSIFKGLEFGVEFSEDRYVITTGLEEEKLKKFLKPFPHVRLTKAQLEIQLYPEFLPKGTLEMELKAGDRKILDASVIVKPGSTGGLYAEGTLNAYIPGVNRAEGKAIYDMGQWSAYAELQSTQMNLPYVVGGTVKAGFNEKGPYGDGIVDLAIPGGHTARVGLHYRHQMWFFSGKGEFHIKRIGTHVVLIIDYFDGKTLKGSGTVKGFNFKGLTGEITVHYEGKVGAARPRIWGDGEFDIKKGRVTGHLSAHLLETGMFSGDGKVSYEIKPGLIASAGILIDEHEKVTLVGSLTFPPYKLFDQHPNPPKRIDLLPPFKKNIPVPFLSFGPLGLQAEIGAGIFVSYGIGPGIIKDGFIKAQVDPLEDDPDPTFELGGRLSVPMFFRVTGYVSGGLVLDVLIAEAGGKLIVSASAELGGEGGLSFWAKYSKGEFKAEVDVKLIVGLVLQLCVDAYAWAEAGVWRFKVKTSKTWNILNFPYQTGLQLGIKGLKKPISYSSKTGFALPSFDDIDWVKPSLDAEDMLKSGIDAAGGEKEEGAPKPKHPCPVIEED